MKDVYDEPLAIDYTEYDTPASFSSSSHHRTIWLSDIHLGSKSCQAEYLMSFLESHSCDTLYLVGDIIDGWKLKSKVYWPRSHSEIVRKFLDMARQGTRIVFVTGNHDEFLRPYGNSQFGNIELVDQACHVTADNRKLLILHGDQFDAVKSAYGWLSSMGAMAYDELVEFNVHHNRLRSRLGLEAWPVPVFVKDRVKNTFINEYEHWISYTARENGFDGAVCGHIHHAQNRMLNGVQYLNCGDWVESCSALVESYTGEINIINWQDELDERQVQLDVNQDMQSLDPLSFMTEVNELSTEIMKLAQTA